MYHLFEKKVTPEIIEQETREFWQRIENGKVTLLKCSPREFTIRWWGMAFSVGLLGLVMGFVLRGMI